METTQHHDDNASWGKRDLEHFEQRLLAERKRAVAQVAQFDDDLRLSPDDTDGEITSWRFHMADEGSDTFEREQNFLLASREGQLVWHIDQALRRIYASPERYGRCDECRSKIGFERLDAIPYATHCVHCKQTWEGGRAD
ncbi:MAG TPA: TraR/DksA C4-type zinc finger protein [Gemmatimonadaceae bacterium]|nr:TraR/DksA C4-type zinc finger protein [Gemmatimonadaceae bacterium]